jgi:hypothetical protein
MSRQTLLASYLLLGHATWEIAQLKVGRNTAGSWRDWSIIIYWRATSNGHVPVSFTVNQSGSSGSILRAGCSLCSVRAVPEYGTRYAGPQGRSDGAKNNVIKDSWTCAGALSASAVNGARCPWRISTFSPRGGGAQ